MSPDLRDSALHALVGRLERTFRRGGLECAQPEAALPWLLPDPVFKIGCTAEYNCVHGTMVNCSSPVGGTCSASGGYCGYVTCGGQTTYCPGKCIGDHHCANFCDWQPNSYCDWGGCCVCG